jgi:hypothetical protein
MKKIIFCSIFIFTINNLIFSFDYLDFKEYIGKNIHIVKTLLPNLKNIDDGIDLTNTNIENLVISYISNLSDNDEKLIIFDVLNDIIIGFDYFNSSNDQYLARTTYEKYKNENIATEFSKIFTDELREYMWFNLSNNHMTHIKISQYEENVFSVKFGYRWMP